MTAPRWPALRALLLAQLRSLGELELGRCVGDGSRMRALEGGSRRPAPGRPRPARLQTPPGLRCRWYPTGGARDRRQPPRRHPSHPADRGHPTDPGSTRPAPPATAGAVRRARPRPRHPPPVVARTRHHAAQRLPRRGSRLPAWAASAGWSSAASPGCTPSSGCAPATSAAPTSTSAYCSWPAPSSAVDGSPSWCEEFSDHYQRPHAWFRSRRARSSAVSPPPLTRLMPLVQPVVHRPSGGP
jgi:hypothetical protein